MSRDNPQNLLQLFSEYFEYGNCVDCPSIDLEDLGDIESVLFHSWIQGKSTYPS